MAAKLTLCPDCGCDTIREFSDGSGVYCDGDDACAYVQIDWKTAKSARMM